MCGVVGAMLTDVTESDIGVLKRVLLETEIRGRHASGIAWFDGKGLHCEKASTPISQFLEDFDLSKTVFDGNIRLIGHIRYSTSDIEYNQPIGNGDSFIVHNGVICQEDPSKWEGLFGYNCETKNDTELLYEAIKNGDDYLSKFEGCSVSALYIDNKGNISNFRNSLRPQWKGILENGYIIASTQNILLRAGVREVVKVTPDDNTDLIHRAMDESYSRIQNVLQER